MHPQRNKAIEMRKAGASFSDITKALGISKSTLSYMLKEVKLTSEQREAIDHRTLAAIRCCVRSPMTAEAKARASNVTKNAWIENRDKMLRGARKSALTYLPHEKKILRILEQRFNSSFKKECVGERFFDFASETLLIEHSIDFGKGIGDIIQRFTAARAAGDRRRRIAFVNMKHLGPKRRGRLAELEVEIFDCFSIGV